MTTQKQTIFLDASALKESACLRRLQNITIHGLTRDGKDNKMEYGTAFHKFVAHWYETGDVNKSLELALKHYQQSDIYISDKDFRTIDHLLQTCMAYAKEYNNDNFKVLRDANGKLLVEQRFAWPYMATDDIEIIICGTIDVIGKIGNEIVICDHKTTAVYDADKYLDGYLLSPQLMMYKFICELIAEAYPSTMSELKGVGAFIDGIFIGKSGAKFKRSGIYNYTAEQMAAFKVLLDSVCHELIRLTTFKVTEYPQNFTCCETIYGHCKYFQACAAPDKESREAILEHNFIRRQYNPLTFGE